jgi:translocation and assembly module TamA
LARENVLAMTSALLPNRLPGAAGLAAAMLLILSSPAAWAQPDQEMMDAMPDVGIPWPDLGADNPPLIPPETSQAPVQSLGEVAEADEATRQAERIAAIDPARPLRYEVRLGGVEGIADDLFRTRFDILSELEKGAGDEANLAQITRRARADTDLVDQLLRTRGYYDAQVRYQLQAPESGSTQRLLVDLDARPGPIYRLTEVSLTGLDPADRREAELRALFKVKPGDPADTDAILVSTDAVRLGMAEGGYPFAKVDEPVLRVDHDTRAAALDVIIATGGYRRYGRISVTGDPPFDAAHVADIARFHSGEEYKASEIVDLERALIQTGLVATADVTRTPGATPDTVDIAIAMTRAPARTIAGELGYGTGEGAHLELSWQHRNLFPPEGALTLRGIVGTQEQGLSATFRRNNYRRRDQALNGQIALSNIDQRAYNAHTITISSSLERQTNIIFQKKWTWSLGVELILSDERDLHGAALTPRRRTYFIAALPTSLAYDGSDDLLDPKRGFRLSGRLSPELSLQAGTFGYVRAQADASGYLPLSDRITLAGRVRVGTIVGASADRIAPTRRFYAGGGGSVRGYSYQAIGPRDLNNDPIGGRSLAEAAVEARFRFGSTNQFGLVPFVDAGTISSAVLPEMNDLRVGAGIGLRYYSSFGPIRVDVGTPINPQPGDPRIGVYVSLGQAF